MGTSASVLKNDDTVSLAILVSNEILCRRLDAVLRALPSIRIARRCTSREQAATVLHTERFDALIVAAADAHWLTDTTVSREVRVLVVGEPRGYPYRVDGIVAPHDLRVDTLREALRPVPIRAVPATAPATVPSVPALPAVAHRNRSVSLTSREVEALSLLVEGLSNKQIARRLAISGHGAKRLVASILLKLDSPNRTSAAVAAIKAGIIDA